MLMCSWKIRRRRSNGYLEKKDGLRRPKLAVVHILRCLIDEKRQDFDYELANLLFWFIHPEGLDSHVTTWLSTITRDEPIGVGKAQFWKWQWPRRLYGSIIKAHLAWSTDGTANSAIKSLRDDVDTSGNLFRIIGTASAEAVLVKELISDRGSKPCDVNLWTWFSTFCLAKCSRRMQTDTQAMFSLSHPTEADPQPMLEYAQSQSTKSTSLMPLRQLGHELRNFCSEKSLLRACFLLRLQDRTSDAEWLKFSCNENIPRYGKGEISDSILPPVIPNCNAK